MPIGARLYRLHLQSPQPEALAAFYARAYGLTVKQIGKVFACDGGGRSLQLSSGAATQLHYALYGFSDLARWQTFLTRASAVLTPVVIDAGLVPDGAVSCMDPDGNRLVFAAPEATHTVSPILEDGAAGTMADRLPPAVNQHFALRTTQIDAMLAFYQTALGFHLSDRVLDGEGRLRACFLRTDSLHHSLALFGAPVSCFDHQSFEAPAWSDLKDWADHLSRERIEIVWGVGRHGPGNDVFFMVRDPDGNLAEISSEIEVCDDARPAGLWPHEERTLNLWGKAIMRS